MNSGDPEEWAIPAYYNTPVCFHHKFWQDSNPVKSKGFKTANFNKECLEAPWDIMITTEKNQSNFAKMLNQMSEQICLNLERRVMIPNLSTLTKKLPLKSLRDRPFNLKGGMVFWFVQNFFFGQHKS